MHTHAHTHTYTDLYISHHRQYIHTFLWTCILIYLYPHKWTRKQRLLHFELSFYAHVFAYAYLYNLSMYPQTWTRKQRLLHFELLFYAHVFVYAYLYNLSMYPQTWTRKQRLLHFELSFFCTYDTYISHIYIHTYIYIYIDVWLWPWLFDQSMWPVMIWPMMVSTSNRTQRGSCARQGCSNVYKCIHAYAHMCVQLNPARIMCASRLLKCI